MKSWKTTLMGVAGGIAIIVGQQLQSGTITKESVITAISIAVLGYFAKDKNVTGKS